MTKSEHPEDKKAKDQLAMGEGRIKELEDRIVRTARDAKEEGRERAEQLLGGRIRELEEQVARRERECAELTLRIARGWDAAAADIEALAQAIHRDHPLGHACKDSGCAKAVMATMNARARP